MKKHKLTAYMTINASTKMPRLEYCAKATARICPLGGSVWRPTSLGAPTPRRAEIPASTGYLQQTNKQAFMYIHRENLSPRDVFSAVSSHQSWQIGGLTRQDVPTNPNRSSHQSSSPR